MGKSQRIVTTILWGCAVLAMLGVVGTGLWAKRSSGARGLSTAQAQLAGANVPGEDGALPAYYDAPQFSLTDQEQRTVTHETLRGDVWVACIFFTHCTAVCPGMMGRLVDLQEAVTDPRVKLVSFTLDPERDTPEYLKQYADRLGADSQRWFLLTGTKEQMFAVAEELKLHAAPAQGDQPIEHADRMLLIDRSGKVRGVYDSGDDRSMEKLAEDADRLARQTEQGS